jgi:hypothetical protein
MASRHPKPTTIDASNVVGAIEVPATQWIEPQLATLALAAPEGVGMHWDEIDQSLGPVPASGNREIDNFYAVGYVDYTFPTDPTTHHQYGFTSTLMREYNKKFVIPNDPKDALLPISVEDILLVPNKLVIEPPAY